MAFVYTSAGSIGMSSTTYGQMATKVARISGAQDSPERIGAFDAVQDSMRRLNEYLWEFCSVTGAEIELQTAQATYDLPTPFHKQMSVRFGNQPLAYIRQSDLDKTWEQAGLAISMYTMWNSQSTGKITIIGTPVHTDPSGQGQLFIKYYRPIALPSADTDVLDVPTNMERFVKLDGQYQVGIEQNIETGKLDRVMRDRESALAGILGFDRDPGPGVDTVFQPNVVHGFPADHAYFHIHDEEY